jgi:hypothetical protein
VDVALVSAGALFPFGWLIGASGVPTRKQLKQADKVLKKVDWSKYDRMSDAEIRRRWAWDKDMTWPSKKELAEFDLVIPAKARAEAATKAKAKAKTKSRGKERLAKSTKPQRAAGAKSRKSVSPRTLRRQVAAE